MDAKIGALSETANHTAHELQNEWEAIKQAIDRLPTKEYSRVSGVLLAVQSHIDDPGKPSYYLSADCPIF